MKADLHNHTTASDGILSINELIDYAKTKNIDILGITDHDTVESFNNYYNDSEIKIIKGVELSTYCNNENIHLLGYFINNEIPEELKCILKDFEEKRKERIHLMIFKLKEQFDLTITYEEIKKYADGVIGRPHVAQAIEKKYNISKRKVFDEYIGNGKPAYVPTEKIGIKEAINLLHNNNAIVVLAHPYLIEKNDIEKLVSLGIDGIEVNYSKHTEQQRKIYRQIAEENNLFITGGSDFHRYKEYDDDIDLGYGTIENKELSKFLKELNIKI